MDFAEAIASRTPMLGEGSVYERLRRDRDVKVDPDIFHACLVYDQHGAAVLERTHRSYIEAGLRCGMPVMALTNTWRANAERIARSRFHDRRVNQDDARFMRELRDSYGEASQQIYIGGMIGPRGDAYKPAEALSPADAEVFHRPQLEALAEGEVDFLKAATLPAVSEAIGIAQAMASTDLPYGLSFVVRRDGRLVDGTLLTEAIRRIDQTTSYSPFGYFVNCVHPDVFIDAMKTLTASDPGVAKRIIGFFANTSDLDPEDLDGVEELQTEDASHLSHLMIQISDRYAIPILGGCCGTDVDHISCLARAMGPK